MSVASCTSFTEPGGGSPFRNILTVSPSFVRVGDTVTAVWTMTNVGDKPYDLTFAPFGPGVSAFLGVSITPNDSTLEAVDLEYLSVRYSGIFFYAHQNVTLHGVFIAAKTGQVQVQACLPPKVNVDDPWKCQSVTVVVHR